jgi:hypothetical protein
MSWENRVVKEIEKRLSEESELFKAAYSPEFAELAKETGLFFSFGDIVHLIATGVSYGMNLKRFGAALMLAGYETLIKRFKLYLLQELKFVVTNKPPFQHDRGPDYDFAAEILDSLKELDRLAIELAKLRKQE